MPTNIHGFGPNGELSPGAALALADVEGGGGASALNDLTDVDTTGQTTGDVLKYNGTSWVADAASAGTVTSTDISDSTAVGRDVLTAADAATARTAIGAGTSSFSGDYDDLTDKPTLGDAAAKDTGTTAGTVAAGDDSRITGAAQKSANLSDLADAGTARTNLGLGTAATTAASAYATAAQGALADTALQGLPTTINTETAAYTLVAGDAVQNGTAWVEMNLGSGADLTVPSAVFSAGQRVDVLDVGTGRVTFVAGSGMTLTGSPSLVSSAAGTGYSILFRSASVAVVVGGLAQP